MSLPSIRGLLARASMESPLGSSTPPVSVSVEVAAPTRAGTPTWPVHPIPAPSACLSWSPALPMKTEQEDSSSEPSATPVVVPRSLLHLEDPAELTGTRDSLSSNSDGTLTPQEKQLLKRARRKEQCRVNQANYRKRKRAFELDLEGQLKGLRQEIERLTKNREALLVRLVGTNASLDQTSTTDDPLALISHFYKSFESTAPQRIKPRHNASPHNGIREQFLGLQYEEFASIQDLHEQWEAYRRASSVFVISVHSSQQWQAGEHLIMEVVGELCWRVSSSAHSGATSASLLHARDGLVCPISQRFLFEIETRTLSRIISEVDWVSAVSKHTASPRAMLQELHQLVL